MTKKINTNSNEVNTVNSQFFNTGHGHCLQLLDIQHPDYMAAIQADTAFWTLVKKENLAQTLTNREISLKLTRYSKEMADEMKSLRFGLTPSAVYFNPTEQCNLNCAYCYIPKEIRKDGKSMSWEKMKDSLQIFKDYFSTTVPSDRKPQIVFHGSEPLLNKEAIFKAIETYTNNFEFGIQTNATLLENGDIPFLLSHKVVIGISLDGHTSLIADRCRRDWAGNGVFKKVLKVLEMCQNYPFFNVICTVTNENVKSLVRIIEFFHKHKVENCLLNQVRCTLEGGIRSKPADMDMAKMFIKALDRSYELYRETGRKIIVANLANILLSIVAPSARRLMCDISPCGGGRCFFAVSAEGDVYPCSEFIGLSKFKGGNLFKDDLSMILKSEPFNLVTNRRVEDIIPCKNCAIKHFCGAPCPAEAYQLHGAMENIGAFCEFYEHQVRYAFRLIADKKESAYLWDNWDKGTNEVFKF